MAESWLQLSVRTSASDLDVLANFLIEQGSPGVILKNSGMEAFFRKSAIKPSLRRDVRRFVKTLARLSGRRRSTLTWKFIEREEWQESWKRFIKPRRVGRNFWVTPPWLEPPKFRHRKVITIEPGMAFGTGTHATTRACMELIEAAQNQLGRGRFSALDVGTGSGILAIVLALLGAKPIYAIDNDPVALRIARANLQANGVAEKVQLSNGPLSAVSGRFNLVVANLTAESILELAHLLEKKTARKGILILSGILGHQTAAVSARFERRFRLCERKRSREWVTVLLERK